VSDHYFAADPSSPFVTVPIEVSVWGLHLSLATGSGVFARGRLDAGTGVLFRVSDPPLAGDTFLDLGCGYGVIGLALALARPQATVWAVDVNERALELTRRNARSHEVEDRVRVARPDEVPDGLRFDGIWSNPPIRVGKDALHEVLEHWLGRLAPGGEATLVVGRNLGADSLQRWLSEQGHPVRRLGSAKGFRVLRTVA